jgi:hypothetical protein
MQNNLVPHYEVLKMPQSIVAQIMDLSHGHLSMEEPHSLAEFVER